MNSGNRVAASIIIGAALIALAIYFGLVASRPRYAVAVSASGYMIRMDTRTGDAMLCQPDHCIPVARDVDHRQTPPGFILDNAMTR